MGFQKRHNKGSHNLYLFHGRSILGGFDVVEFEKKNTHHNIHSCPELEDGIIAWGLRHKLFLEGKNIPNCFEKKETSEGLFRAIPSSTERNLSQSDAFIPPYCCNQQKWTWKGTSQEGMNVTMAHQQYRVGESKTF